jgi:hypothetical protein
MAHRKIGSTFVSGIGNDDRRWMEKTTSQFKELKSIEKPQ